MRANLIGSACALLLAGALGGCTPTAVAPASTPAAAHMGAAGTAAPTYAAVGGAAKTEKPKITTAPPLVQDCGVVAISTPARYACNGKTYTSFQLTKMRADYAKNGYWQEP
jgi:hypothetical protein